MAKKVTTENFVQRMKVINPEIKILGEYENNRKKIKYQCMHGHINYATPSSLLANHGCPNCNGGARYSQDKFVKRVHDINPNIEILGAYINYQTPVKCRCLIHDIVITPYPTSLLKGGGCPKCRDDRFAQERKKTIEQFISDLSTANSKIEVLGSTYINAHTPILCKCKDCGFEWYPTPHNVLRGEGCPKCGNKKFSVGEQRIQNYLDKHHVVYQRQYGFSDCKDQKKLLFDFAVFQGDQLRCLIEYDGRQHYEPVCFNVQNDKNIASAQQDHNKTVYHDNIKNKYCHDNNIQLIRIPYWDLENIEQILNDQLGLRDNWYSYL